MARRPAHTILFIKSDLIARADFGPAPELAPAGFWEQPQSGNVRPYYSIEAALELGGKCGKTVWVMGEMFWTQTLSLPRTALTGLNREQIAKAIGFDVEALTGVSGADSAFGFCKAGPTDDAEHLWVIQVQLAARTQIQGAIEAAGGTLAGIIHPGGLPAPFDAGFNAGAPVETWRRVEVWKETTFCLTGRGSDVLRLTIINGDPAQDAWRVNVARWVNSNPAAHSEWLGPKGAMAGESLRDAGKPWVSLPPLDGSGLQRWLGGWASKLINTVGVPAWPIVGPNRADTVRRNQHLAVAAVALACACGCGLRGYWLANERAVLTAQSRTLSGQQAEKTKILADLQAPKRQWDELQQKIKELRSDLQARRSERLHANVNAIPDFALERHRVNGLLEALAREANPDLLIEHIAPQGQGTTLIEGKCLPNMSIETFADKLESGLPATGWEASPAQRKPLGLVPAAQFSLQVTPLVRKTTPDGPDEIIPSSSLAGGMK